METTEKKCGCKGIRTCLLCESEKGKLSGEENRIIVQYLYCLHCNLCWPVDSEGNTSPLYLGRLTVIPDFITEDEEDEIIAAIDTIEWMPSQSGRKKQDFGPKVNFKKKKGKIGDFKGFPHFTENLIKRLEQHEDLSDFKPVELCHLDYDPDRGSAIEPHIDDSWIWGERLVTINLASPTILTFTPANHEADCYCHNQCLDTLHMSSMKVKCCSNNDLDAPDSYLQTIKQNEHFHCKVSAGCSLNDPNDSCNSNKENGHCSEVPFSYSLKEPNGSNCNSEGGCTTCDTCTQCIEAVSLNRCTVKENNHCNHKISSDCLLHDQTSYPLTSLASNSAKDMCDYTETISSNTDTMKENNDCDYKVPCSCPPVEQVDPFNSLQNMCTIHNFQGIKRQNKERIQENRQCNCKVLADCFMNELNNSTQNTIKDSTLLCHHKEIHLDELKNYLKCPEPKPIKDMCTEYRTEQKTKNVEVLVPLPPRSLVVVAGCCRHNWFHGIKRKDVVSRRLAMTFRELSWSFLAGGPDQALGAELLELGRTFWEIKS